VSRGSGPGSVAPVPRGGASRSRGDDGDWVTSRMVGGTGRRRPRPFSPAEESWSRDGHGGLLGVRSGPCVAGRAERVVRSGSCGRAAHLRTGWSCAGLIEWATIGGCADPPTQRSS
jgi:hypothetical protein